MSNVIQFLEAMGRNPGLSRLSAADYAASVAALDLQDEQRDALLTRDQDALNGLLGGRTKMYCYVARPDEREQESIPDDKDGDGVPDDEESPLEKE